MSESTTLFKLRPVVTIVAIDTVFSPTDSSLATGHSQLSFCNKQRFGEEEEEEEEDRTVKGSAGTRIRMID